jgi:imidazolonepropionase-like amidohydrolase
MHAPSPRNPAIRAAVLVVAALLAACSRTTAPAASGDTLVLRNFTLIDGTDRPPVQGAAMVVDAGRISWVGAASDLSAPDNATTMDLNGGFVMPGLIDLHAHVGNTVDLVQDRKFHTRESAERDLGTLAAYGVTTVLSMGTDQDTIFGLRDTQRSSRPRVARVYTAGQGLMFEGGYGGLAGVNNAAATPEEAAAEVNAQVDKGADIIKLWLDSELGTMPKMPPAMTQAIIDTAHRRGRRAVAHVFYLEDAKRLVEQGIDGFVHSVRDQPVDQALVDAMKQRGVWQVAGTLSREAAMFAYGSTPAFASDPFFTNRVSPAAIALIRSPERQQTIAKGPYFSQYPAFFEQAKANLKRLADAGVPFGFGTDAGPPGRFPGYSAHWELQLMVEAGFTPAQAIASATRRAADFLGAADLGTLEAGKWADFVVLDADPLADIRNTRTIRSVYVAGGEVPSINQPAAQQPNTSPRP